jgi:hypothetical protein
VFLNECLSPLSLKPAISCSAVSMTPAKNFSPVSTKPAINPCRRFSVIAGVIDTGDKFIAGDNNTGEQLSPVTTTPVINLLPVTTTPVIRVCGKSIDASFHSGSNEITIGHVRLWRPEISPFWFEVVLTASRASNQGVWDVYGRVFSW